MEAQPHALTGAVPLYCFQARAATDATPAVFLYNIIEKGMINHKPDTFTFSASACRKEDAQNIINDVYLIVLLISEATLCYACSYVLKIM